MTLKKILTTLTLVTCTACTLLSCGYHMGFSKPTVLQHAKSVTVEMFDNNSLEPLAGILVTNAITDTLQRDGTFVLASRSRADVTIRGVVKKITFDSVRPNPQNTYVSSEIALHLEVSYQLIDKKSGKVVLSGTLDNEANFYNESGNVQAARESALAYAAQKIAEDFQFMVMSS